MAKIHDLFIVELAEVIKGYGNDPDAKDPFRLSEFYRFYELLNIAVSRENFEKMRPIESEQKKGEWIPSELDYNFFVCSACKSNKTRIARAWKKSLTDIYRYCPNCGADMRGDAE